MHSVVKLHNLFFLFQQRDTMEAFVLKSKSIYRKTID